MFELSPFSFPPDCTRTCPLFATMFPGEATVLKMENVPEPTFVTVCPFIVNVPYLIPYRLVPPHEPSPVISTSLNMSS